MAPPLVNLILLLTKQYIVTCKLGNDDRLRTPKIACVTEIINREAQVEKIVAKKKNKIAEYCEKWGLILDERGNVAIADDSALYREGRSGSG